VARSGQTLSKKGERTMATYRGTSGNDSITPTYVTSGVTTNHPWWSPPQHWVYDYLYGYGGSDVLDGGSGGDYMNGGDGNDTYYINSTSDTVYEQYNDTYAGVDKIFSTISYTLPSMIENLTLQGSASLNATGNAKSNVLVGNSAGNVLNGLGGADTMNGGDGNDTYVVDNIGDKVSETYNDSLAGVDKVLSTVSFTLASMIENLTLQGTANINATGNAKANTLIGNSGNNKLVGGLGADQLNGGAGFDHFDFNATSESNGTTQDRILGFQFGSGQWDGDKIDVSTIDANTSLTGNQAFKWGGTTLKGKGYLWAENLSNGDTLIKGNVDNDTDAEFQVAVADGSTAASYWASIDFFL
jgi:Ca2+-binding RTX toxin-like protein